MPNIRQIRQDPIRGGVLSTIYIPPLPMGGGSVYETCVFAGCDSEVIKVHGSLKDALTYHERALRDLGKPGVLERLFNLL